MIPQIDNSLTDVIKQNKIPNRTYKIVSDIELKTVLGEPTILTGSSIEIKDNAYSELDIPKVYGKSVQATRSGINQFDLDKVSWNTNMYSRLNTGIKLNGTWATSIMGSENVLKTFKPNTTYTMRTKSKILSKPSNVKENNNNLFILYRNNSHELGGIVQTINYMTKAISELNKEYINISTFTTPEDMTDVSVLTYTFYGNNDGSTNYTGVGEIEVYDIMLVEGIYTEENFPEYEAYGASPSPEFPSEIQSVGDNVNLFDKNTMTAQNLYIASTGSSGIGRITKPSGTGNALFAIPCEQNAEYTITYDFQNNPLVTIFRTGYIESDELEESLVYSLSLTLNSAHTLKTSSSAKYIIVQVSHTYYENIINSLQIKKGTVATAYSEYGKGTVEIKQSGKNLIKFPYAEKSVTRNGITYTVNNDGTVLVNGTATNDTYFKLSTDVDYGDYDIDGGNNGKNDKYAVPITSRNTAYMYFNKRIKVLSINVTKNITINNLLFKPILIEGALVTQDDYEPYFEINHVIQTTPLRSLPNGVCDTIEEDGIHRRVRSIVLDGVTYKFSGFDSDANNRCFATIGSSLPNNYQIENSYCSHFDYNLNVYRDTNDEIGFVATNTRFYFRFSSSSDIKTIGLANNWLAEQYANGTPVILNFPLAEEVIEPFDEFKNIQNIETLNKRIIYLDAISEVNPEIDAKYYSVDNVSYEQEEVSRIMGFVDNLEAIKQSAYHILGVERYSSDIYDFNYGVELEQYIGQSLEYIEATIQDTLQEALTQDERILGVEVTEITQTSVDCVYIKFNLICYLDEIEMEVYINV